MEKANVKINKGIMLGWTVIGVTLFVAYILELVKKRLLFSRSPFLKNNIN